MRIYIYIYIYIYITFRLVCLTDRDVYLSV